MCAGRTQPVTARGVIATSAVRKPGPKLSADNLDDMALLTDRQTRRLASLH